MFNFCEELRWVCMDVCVTHSDPRHVDWVHSYLSIWTEMQLFIKQYHATGLAWSSTVSLTHTHTHHLPHIHHSVCHSTHDHGEHHGLVWEGQEWQTAFTDIHNIHKQTNKQTNYLFWFKGTVWENNEWSRLSPTREIMESQRRKAFKYATGAYNKVHSLITGG